MALCARGQMGALSTTAPARRGRFAAAAPRASKKAVRVAAFFKLSGSSGKEERDEQYRLQQELLEKRRTGSMIREAGERRRKVSQTLAERKAARQEEKEALGRGEMPESLLNWKNYKKQEDADGTGGIVVPLNPLGMRMFDEGERFDLRSPYAEEGWVDPEETDAFASLKNIGKKLLNFRGRQGVEEAKPKDKRIIWASQWEKEQAAKKGGGKK